MNTLHKDILNGLLFIGGIVAFTLEQYIVSSAIFAATTYASSINMNRKKYSK